MCPIYDDVAWLRETVDGAYPEIDKLYIFLSDHPWHGAPRRDIRAAMRAICDLPDPDGKIEVLHDTWPNEESTRNAAMQICRECGADYCMFLDSDEIWDPAALVRVKAVIAAKPDVQYWYTWWTIYWKNRLNRVEPQFCGTPLVFVKLDGKTKIGWLRTPSPGGIRCTVNSEVGALHHMSYVRSDTEMRNKIRNIQVCHGVAHDWFERVWKGWEKNQRLENLHPVDPSAFRHTVSVAKRDLPPALRR